MQFYELAHDGETEAGSGAAGATVTVEARAEPAEHAVPVFRRHARTGVRHLQHGMTRARQQLAADAPRRRRVADRVGEEVRDDPAQALDVEAAGERVRRLHGQVDPAVGRQRLERLRDRTHGAREIGVHERELRLPVVGLDLFEHVVDLFERAERGNPDVDDLRAHVWGGIRAQELLGAGHDDVQRSAQIVRELAEKPFAIVVDAGKALRERRQLRVLAPEPLLHPLAVRDRAAFRDDERDTPIAAAQRPDHEVQRAGLATGDANPDVEAGEPTLGRGRDRGAH